jgi:hypothetical protein
MRLVIGFLMAFSLSTFSAGVARADGCYLCRSGSSCDQCRYGSTDTQDARKACEARGCKVEGTTSCSSAVNIKVCKVNRKDVDAVLACR